MNRGYIKIWRKIRDSWLIKDPNALSLLIHLLINAEWQDGKTVLFNGKQIALKAGQVTAGSKQLAEWTGQSRQMIREATKRLKTTNIITTQTTNRFTLFSIVNFKSYQGETTNQATNPTTIKQPSSNQQTTTLEEFKHLKNSKKKVASLPNEDFLKTLKNNPAYKHLDLDKELGKCQAWCIANKKMCSQRRFVNWINRAEKPMAFVPQKEKKPNSGCSACSGTGKLPDGVKCWCY